VTKDSRNRRVGKGLPDEFFDVAFSFVRHQIQSTPVSLKVKTPLSNLVKPLFWHHESSPRTKRQTAIIPSP
jgi:hypothetical protein